jgi:hypothetical protein
MGSLLANPGVTRSALTADERTLVLAELTSMLASKHFRNSKRYPVFLDFVVRTALTGDAANLKERTLGVEIFGRSPSYDTGADPIVRVTAGEVRKRIAQYHDTEGRAAVVRIDLPSGSYLPDFHFVEAGSAATEPVVRIQAEPLLVREPENLPVVTTPSNSVATVGPSRWKWFGAAGIIFAACLAIAGWYYTHRPRTLWDPLFATSQPTLIVVGPATRPRTNVPSPTEVVSPDELARASKRIALSDALSVGQICGIVDSNHHRCQVKAVGTVTLSDLRSGPAVLIGAFNNDWTIRLAEPLRFYFLSAQSDPQVSAYRSRYIIDRTTNQQTSPWRSDPADVTKLAFDYSVIARFRSGLTDNYVVLVAGLTAVGTEGATEFITSPENLAALRKLAPRGGSEWSFEAVLQTQVIGGRPGHTQVVATEFWH